MSAISRDPFAPRYRITMNNGDVLSDDIARYISKVEYEDESDKMDKMTVTLTTNNVTERGVTDILEASKFFKEGNSMLLEGGYGNSLFPIGKVDIVKRQPKYPRDSYPSVEIVGYDPFFKLVGHKPSKGVSYKQFRDSQIATIIASRHGIDYAKVRKADGKFDRVQKKGQNDLEFLLHVAEVRGFDCYLRYDKDINKHRLYFEPPTDRQEKVFTFKYGLNSRADETTLFEFDPEINMIDQSSKIEIIIFDKKDGKAKKSILEASDIDDQQLMKAAGRKKFFKAPPLKSGGAVRAKVFGQNVDILAGKAFENEADAKRFVEQYFRKRNEHFITGSGTLIGLETLQARQTHILEGLGTQLSGKYFFTRVHHIFDSGKYECKFDCRKIVGTK